MRARLVPACCNIMVLTLPSPATPSEHAPDSPIWDSVVTAVEAFYPADDSAETLIHAFIVREPGGARSEASWQCAVDIDVNMPGFAERRLCYTTEELVAMIRNRASRRSTRRPLARGASFHGSQWKISRADVCSIQLRYCGRYVFLDRDEGSGNVWSSSDLCLSTAAVQAILSSS
ncbi:hypothetical protein BS50DRAFT_261910 [Corynespora cassiicola Philippines]|uniref:Uncharacterized protein n=1 Tax=Corynespora cassiicola Philippines TaxID=1448308 RepID=A0A2T2N158_CORCC|nr:hypothetical protein BS50DRAFT_261910 [Corynespora cassiicola Philippines]